MPALFLFFLKVGSVLFGSGYVLLAFLRADLVEHWQWLTESQLLDAIAVGQLVPGPVFTTATFIGYVLGGPWAAFLATVGIFLPAFFFVAISGPLIPRLRSSSVAGAFLDGVNVASLALMGVVTAQLGAAALVDWLAVLLAAGSVFLLLRYRELRLAARRANRSGDVVGARAGRPATPTPALVFSRVQAPCWRLARNLVHAGGTNKFLDTRYRFSSSLRLNEPGPARSHA